MRRVSIDDESPADTGMRTRLLAVWLAVVLVAALFGAVWLFRPRPAAVPSQPPNPAAPVAAAARPAAAEPAASEPASPAPATVPARGGSRRAKVAAPSPEPAAPALALKVDSDVAGASVFVDRAYVGKTPLTTSEVTPGSHVVQVSAEGYESQSKTIEIAAGSNDVTVRFKVVQLNEAVPVVHKHAIGSCDGRLVANLQGLRYETPNSEHAFAIPFPELRSFEVDYLKKNLRVTRKDGKTFNFTDRHANADVLFVFHKKVEAARAKLAAGFTPADK